MEEVGTWWRTLGPRGVLMGVFGEWEGRGEGRGGEEREREREREREETLGDVEGSQEDGFEHVEN